MNTQWKCSCGNTASDLFCSNCGQKCTMTAAEFGNRVRNDIKAFLRRPYIMFFAIFNTLTVVFIAFFLAVTLFSGLFSGSSVTATTILSLLLNAASLALSVYVCISLWQIRLGARGEDFLTDMDGLRSLSRALFLVRYLTYINYGFSLISTVIEFAAHPNSIPYGYDALIPVIIAMLLLIAAAYHFLYLYLQRCVDSVISRIEEPTAKTYVKSTPAAIMSFIFMGLFGACGLIMLLVDFFLIILTPVIRTEMGEVFDIAVLVYVAVTVISALLAIFWLFLALYILKYNKLEREYAESAAELQIPDDTYAESKQQLNLN